MAPPALVAEQTEGSRASRDYSATLKAYGLVGGGLRGAKSDRERKLAVQRLGAFPAKFIDISAKYPEDPLALTALKQAVQVVGSTDSAHCRLGS